MSDGPIHLRRIARRCTSAEPMQISAVSPPRPVPVPRGMSAAQANAILRTLPRPMPEDFGLPPFDDRDGTA